ncbi:transglutaminase-like superfamily protein [Methanobrevibacter cuticularis]|uniref:Transglutaminase-like superfamily protein n=1 Tax=Methanobrevibacter cuticularis TaxID=47311 RepID=A0A166CP62_9EURY|nr:transglutaminase-like domain-containing protein [Methanobrevibacter cuticularis]KZX14712.1 transglutaminase-like superfamily protein [Methanobrevibacter cuticularis]
MPNKSIKLKINTKKLNLKSDKNGIATYKFKTVKKSKSYKIKITASYSLTGKTFKTSKSVTVGSTPKNNNTNNPKPGPSLKTNKTDIDKVTDYYKNTNYNIVSIDSKYICYWNLKIGNDKAYNPYIQYSYDVTVNKSGAISKKYIKFSEKSSSDILLIGEKFDSKLNKYLSYKDSRCQVNHSDIKTLVKKIISSNVKGELNSSSKGKAIFEWIRNNVKYKGYECSHFKAVKVINRITTLKGRENANCADQSILLVSMLRTVGIPAYFENWANCQFARTRGGHVWVQAYISNTIKYKLDTTSSRNSFGIINSWKKGNRLWFSESLSRLYLSLW